MAQREIPSWVAVGSLMMEVHTSSWRTTYGNQIRITKVHKNGNFCVGESNKQWRPSSDYAFVAGNHYGGATLWPVTGTLLAEVAQAKRLVEAERAVRNEIIRLEKLRADDDIIAEHERLKKRVLA